MEYRHSFGLEASCPRKRQHPAGAFPDVQSSLMFVCVPGRLRPVADTEWRIKRYINMNHLHELDMNLISQQVGQLTATEWLKFFAKKSYYFFYVLLSPIRQFHLIYNSIFLFFLFQVKVIIIP